MMVNVKAFSDIVVNVLLTSSDDNYVIEMRMLNDVAQQSVTVVYQPYLCFKICNSPTSAAAASACTVNTDVFDILIFY